MTLENIKNEKVYISGKMTGLQIDDIIRSFGFVENVLVDNDNSVMNPAVLWYLKNPVAFTAEEYLRVDFAMMDNCNIVIVLPNWQTSNGAKQEIEYAKKTNMKIYFLKELARDSELTEA